MESPHRTLAADLTADGELVNRKDKRGYRLPDWPKPSRAEDLFK